MNVQPVSPGTVSAGRPATQDAGAVPKAEATPRAAAAEIPKTARDAQELSAKAVEEAVDKVAQFIAQTTSEINISVDKDSGMRVVKVVDTETKEVLRQIPSEEVVAIAQALDKLQGLFLRDKA